MPIRFPVPPAHAGRRFGASMLVLAVLAASPARADRAPRVIGAGLEDGPHAVGFRTLEGWDRSREFFRTDDPGTPTGGRYGPRPQRIELWYPARRGSGAPMRFDDYVIDGAGAKGTSPDASPAEARERFRRGRRADGADSSALERLLAAGMRARKDARPATGRFPLILYFHTATHEKSVLCEFLASHGFVVASAPVLGSWERDFDVGTSGVETEIRDLENVRATLATEPGIDTRRVGVVGMSFGALAALGYGMRHPEVKAVVSLDGGIGSVSDPAMLRRSAFHSAGRATVPLLHLYGLEVPGTDLGYLRSLESCDRRLVGFAGLRHADFASYGVLSSVVPDLLGPASPETPRRAAAALRAAGVFLRAFVAGDAGSRAALDAGGWLPADSTVRVERIPARPAPPPLEVLKGTLASGGLDRLAGLRDSLDRVGATDIAPDDYRALGSWLLERERVEDARTWWGLYLEDYPASARAHALFAGLALRLHDERSAREHYERALALVDADPELDDAARARIATRARAALAGLPER